MFVCHFALLHIGYIFVGIKDELGKKPPDINRWLHVKLS